MGHDTSHDAPAHDSGVSRGEEKGASGREAGRHDLEESHANRPAGHSSMRDSTGINADDRAPIDPAMPTLIPA